MHTLSLGAPFADQPGRRGFRDIVDAESAAEFRRPFAALALVVHHHDVAGHPHLVRMPAGRHLDPRQLARTGGIRHIDDGGSRRSEEHTSELQSLMRISYAVFCLKKKKY